MKAFSFNVPESLREQRNNIEEVCNLLIHNFNKLCDIENERIRVEKQKLLDSRTWKLSIEDIHDGWRILVQTADKEIPGERSKLWSRPFKILDNVLFHSDNSYQSTSYVPLTNLIPQGRFSEEQLQELLKETK